jgi:NTE family protein
MLDRLQIRDIQKVQYETVLILQGGGSLGAYECGVYKTLEKHGIEFDVVAGTSIGAVNAAIIVGSKTNSPAQDLEHFWLTLADNITP